MERLVGGIGEMPVVDQKAMHVSTMEAPESLPNLVEALETLDEELGFSRLTTLLRFVHSADPILQDQHTNHSA